MNAKSSVAFLLLFLFEAVGSAQDSDPEKVKKAILEKVRAKLAAERANILRKVAAIIDRELTSVPNRKDENALKKRIGDLEKKLRVLDEHRDEVRSEIGKMRRLMADLPLRKEAQAKGPKSQEEAQGAFQAGIRLFEAKDYDGAVKAFKLLFYRFPKTNFAGICAYNVACAYALGGKKDHGLDWLEIAVANGYRNFEHMRKDADLTSLRKEKRYLKLLTDQ